MAAIRVHSVQRPLRMNKCDEATRDETHIKQATVANARFAVTHSEFDLLERFNLRVSPNLSSRQARLGI